MPFYSRTVKYRKILHGAQKFFVGVQVTQLHSRCNVRSFPTDEIEEIWLILAFASTDHSLESSISADTHFLSQSGTTHSLSECSLRLSGATCTKCCGTCTRSQLQC